MQDKILRKKLSNVKLLSLDTDGVLTGGEIYFDDSGQQIRKFNVKDGMGINLVMQSGVKVVIISASSTKSIKHRAKQLGIEYVFLGVKDKSQSLLDLCETLAISLEEVVHVGDDVNDIPVMDLVGCSISVADAVASVKESADLITEKRGGEGAVREICDMILTAKPTSF